MLRSEPGGRGRFIGPKVSCLSVLCRSYGAWLTSATGASYKHGAPPELAPGALTSVLPALAALEFKGKDVGNAKRFSGVLARVAVGTASAVSFVR
jgi:hypothetical protein